MGFVVFVDFREILFVKIIISVNVAETGGQNGIIDSLFYNSPAENPGAAGKVQRVPHKSGPSIGIVAAGPTISAFFCFRDESQNPRGIVMSEKPML